MFYQGFSCGPRCAYFITEIQKEVKFWTCCIGRCKLILHLEAHACIVNADTESVIHLIGPYIAYSPDYFVDLALVLLDGGTGIAGITGTAIIVVIQPV